MRILLFLFSIWTAGVIPAHGQFIEPVKWSFDSEVGEDGTAELIFRASIEKGWHLYSQHIEDGGPIPTTFYFEDGVQYTLNGSVRESGEEEETFDDIFGMELSWFKNTAEFRQKVTFETGRTPVIVEGEVEFMVCNDRECLPPDYIPYRFELSAPPDVTAQEKVTPLPVNEQIQLETIPEEPKSPTEKTTVEVPQPAFETKTVGPEVDPVAWSYRLLKEGDTYTAEWKADIAGDWHLYSSQISDEGPIPTTFYFDHLPHIEWAGDLSENGEAVEKFDDVFGMNLIWFEHAVVFRRSFSLTEATAADLEGSVEFMVCDEEQCLPPEELGFSIDITRPSEEWVPIGEKVVEVFPPADCEGIPGIMCPDEFDNSLAKNDCTGEPVQENSRTYWIIFLIGFGGGLIALLTPCVFPMIPLTVSFFTKGSEKANAKGIRNAIIYGVSIIVIYVSLGLAVTLIFGPEMLNWIATSPVFNIVFFLIFVFFAFSFFGYYELTLPSSWTNKTDQIAAKGGLIGIFFMAFTLALVSFSCTGPIIGSLIVEAVRQGVMGPFFGMLGFAVALALPFTLFAIFPKWLNSLPQSGGWLNSVKVFLGFLELAFALKFFSTADLTRHWGILKYELFIGLWVIIFILLGLYLLGVFRFPHDSKGPTGWLKRSIGAGSIAFSVYLLIGMAQHKPLLGGIAPAPGYSFLNPSKCPEGVNICFHDYEEGMAYARANDRPVMLDFTGYGCVNCRLMENNVWGDPEVNRLLNEYVIISLYVDDRADLPEKDQYVSTATGKTKEIRKVGKYWHDFQFRHFGTLSQPYYVLVGPEQQILNKPIAFSDKQEYLEFLRCGLENLKGVCPECVAAPVKP